MRNPYDDDDPAPQRNAVAWKPWHGMALVVGLGLIAAGLARPWASSTATPEVRAAPRESRVIQVCREDEDIPAVVAKATAEGWTYAGPLTPNGINCYVGLWTRPAK